MSQQNPIDSLKKVIIAAPNDTNKVNMLIELSMKYRGVSLDSTIKYGMDAKTLAEKQNYAKGTGYALKAIGLAYNMQGDYVNAMQAYKEALAIFEANGIKVGVANMLNNIGVIFYYYSLLDSAQDYYLKSLKISEEIKDTLRIATALAGVGGVYSWKAATYDKAMEFHRRALLLGIASGDSDLVAGSNGNIADLFVSIFLYQKDTIKQNQKTPDSLHPDSTLLDSAILYLKQAQKFYGVLPNLPFALNSIGKVYKMKKEFHLAEDYYRQGYDKAKYFDSKKDMADALLGIAETYREKGDLKAAIPVYIDAEKMFLDIGLEETYDIEIVYSGLTTCFSKLKDYDSAFKYQKSLIDVKKKIYDIDTDKKLGTKLFAFEVEKREGEIILQKAVISRQKLIRNGFIGGFAVVLLFAGVFFTQRNRISKEKKRSDELLLNILPEETAEELKATGTAKAKSFDMVSVLFTDFKNFTQASEILTPEELVAEINHCYSEFDKIITRHGIEKIKTIGDAYMCAGGLPRHNSTNPVDVVSAGLEMVAFIEKNKQERIANGQPFFELRCGIHTGPVVAGIVGIKKFAYDIWGDTVNTASRMESSGEIGKVNVSGATYELVKDKFKCNYRGKVKAKNKGEIDMYFVESLIGLHMV
jgi:class 3 adenylate cyclase